MNSLSDSWNSRYANEEFVYGELPNEYFKQQLAKLPIGNILFPAEGEGRNAVYAAQLGWNVSAYDISSEGKKKALQLAEKKNATIDYRVGELENLHYENEQFDAIALIFAHFNPKERADIHNMLSGYLRPGGTIIVEGFSKNHLRYQAENPQVGGPRDIDFLYSADDIKNDFPHYEIIELQETETNLSEGSLHNGLSSVIRFIGRKND